MTGTWEEIFTNSLFRAGILGRGQIMTASMLAEAQSTMKLLLDELDGEGLALPVMSIDVAFNTVVNQEKYVLGKGVFDPPANPIRPETVLTGTVEIESGLQPVVVPLSPMAFVNYRTIPSPKVTGQPFQYSINPKWPQSDLYLYPVPSQIWPINLTCKVRWVDTVGDPACNICAIAQLNSGFTNALTDIQALRLAENNRLETSTLQKKADKGKYLMTQQMWNQHPDLESRAPDAFPWTLVQAGTNPR